MDTDFMSVSAKRAFTIPTRSLTAIDLWFSSVSTVISSFR